MHSQPPDPELQNQIWTIFKKWDLPLKCSIFCYDFHDAIGANPFAHLFRYESSIEVEIQQRAVEYFALSRKGAALMDILAEMPKFPERQVFLQFWFRDNLFEICIITWVIYCITLVDFILFFKFSLHWLERLKTPKLILRNKVP